MRRLLLLAYLAGVLSTPTSPPPNCTTVVATATDSAMKWTCEGSGVQRCTNQHIACVPAGVPAGLVVFMPGTYLQPADYSLITAEFASHGYLALNLFYPSAEGQNSCSASRASTPTDLNCTARERFKVLTGEDNGGYTNITQVRCGPLRCVLGALMFITARAAAACC